MIYNEFIVITKTDLSSTENLVDIYGKTPYKLFQINYDDCESLAALKDYLSGKLAAFTGNSGVGKSTLINALCPGLALPTADISEKLGRGRHTTRQAEIFHIADGLVIDSAGFSSIEFSGENIFLANELEKYFKEFGLFY